MDSKYNHLEDTYAGLRIRFTEQKLLESYSKGLLRGTVHTCVGQELGAVLVIKHLNSEFDWVLSTHRGHGHFLAFNGTPFLLFAELLGISDGPSKGFGGSQHIRLDNFITNGVQGGFMPVANGIASALLEKSNERLCVNFIGDGTLGEGAVWESLNVAAVFGLPVLFVCEDNGIAQSTLTSTTFHGSLEKRIEGFGLVYFFADVLKLDEANLQIEKAVRYARVNQKPVFLHIKTQRLNAHSKGDDNRNPELIKLLSDQDYLNIFMADQSDIVQSKIREIRSQIELDYQKALTISKRDNTQIMIKTEYIKKDLSQPKIIEGLSILAMRVSINLSLEVAMKKFENLRIYGEDIEHLSEGTLKPYGGAFKVTDQLSQQFPGRVSNFPIAESGLIGLAIGRALVGLPTIVEVMFGDFITLGFDQIVQNMSKIPSMYGRQIELPVIIRTPMGGGFGYGATHSQSLEKHFLGLPNVTVVAVCIFTELENFYSNLIETRSPHLVIENKRDYNQTPKKILAENFILQSIGELYKIYSILPITADEIACIITYGGMTSFAHQAQVQLYKQGISIRLIVLEKLSPLDLGDFSGILATKIVIVEEGLKEGGVGAEILAQISELGISNHKVLRITGTGIIGSNKASEDQSLPSTEEIYTSVIKFLLGDTLEHD